MLKYSTAVASILMIFLTCKIKILTHTFKFLTLINNLYIQANNSPAIWYIPVSNKNEFGRPGPPYCMTLKIIEKFQWEKH